MSSDNPELVLLGLVILIMVMIFAVIWFVFMVPMEKGIHKRRMELIRKRLEQNEERLRREREARERQDEADERPARQKRASGGRQ